MTELRNTFGGGGFICAFSERELSEFHNFLEKEFPFTQREKVKKGITCVGKQPIQCQQNQVIWVLNPDIQISEDGSFVPKTESEYVWQPIGGPQIEVTAGRNAPISLHSEITLPLESKDSLNKLLQIMASLLKHNFIAGIL